MSLCLIHTWVYRRMGCSLSLPLFCTTGAAKVLHVLDVFFTLVFFLELLVRLCPGKNNTWRILGCITMSNHWCLVADLLSLVFLFSQDFSTQFHFEHARNYYMSKVLDDPLDDPLFFFANHFAALSSEVDLWNLIFQARIDFWIDFSNGFSWLIFFCWTHWDLEGANLGPVHLFQT